ncbi:hypothetical protein F4821DRAFT_280930 [Hypoxylon rubiginosum]|uniref:Uncharacterized protein n=1 Tax=Hypoxylon rubiginosum TaxID=110542 RepID=A0ACC0CST1_9PEZI|nr:hypothetical protein F4821DRAFT_280930 [Hypoxylon rubiginosum]
MSDSSKEGIYALSGTLMGLCTISVGLRFWARRRHKLRFMADDWLASFALLSFYGSLICSFIMIHNKVLGYSSNDFTPEELAATAKTDKVSEIARNIISTNTLACIKLSAVFFYRRIFCSSGDRTIFGIITWITIVVVTLWLIAFEFLTGFQCGTHFSALWDGSYTQYCTISFPFLYGLAISDFLLDVWILVLPIPSILRLNTTLKRKLSIIGIFLLALIGIGASIARMVQYVKVELGGPEYLLHTDYQRSITQSIFYVTLEAGMGIIAINLPSLRVFSISFKPADMITSVRSLLELSFLRSRSSNVGQTTPAASINSGVNENEKARSFSTRRPSEGSNAVRQDTNLTSLSFLEDTEGQKRNVALHQIGT